MNTKTLSAARRRRDEGERPLPLDYLWLAGEKPNRRGPQAPARPTEKLDRAVLDLLRARPAKVGEIARQTKAPEREVRASIDRLRNGMAWPIVNVAGHFAVVRLR
jgi:hypothetical protein